MNTNSNTYTVIYTTVVCVLVAAILAFVSQTLKPKQDDNIKAETVGQILSAANFEFNASSNDAILKFYKENIKESVLIDAQGNVAGTLDAATAEVYGTSELKAQNYKIEDGSYTIPAYEFKNGVTVLALYGAGLWGPIWGYIAVDESGTKIVSASFDHASETPGLGGKIKDDPKFSEQFNGKVFDFNDPKETFSIVKGGAPEGKQNAIDAISGATLTSKGVSAAINNWVDAYKNYLLKKGTEE